jgi:hypothetical protein
MLDVQLYEMIKKHVLMAETDTETGGKGQVKASTIYGIRVEFQDASDQDIKTVKGLLDVTMALIEEIRDSYQTDYLLPRVLG